MHIDSVKIKWTEQSFGRDSFGSITLRGAEVTLPSGREISHDVRYDYSREEVYEAILEELGVNIKIID